MMTPPDTDISTAADKPAPRILIIGAGPVGLTMAAELRRYGIPVRIIDKAAQRTEKSRAVVVWGRTLEMLDRLGCADIFVAAGIQAKVANLIASEKQWAKVDFGLLDSPFHYALMLPQSETERLLEEHLAKLDVSVERLVELRSLRQDGKGVEAILHRINAQGESLGTETVHADWMIGCDGAHSVVRKLMGQRFAGHTFPTEWLMADLYLDGLPTPPNEPALFFHGEGVLALFPIGANNLYRLAANLGPALEEGRGREVSLAEIETLIERRGPPGVTAKQGGWHATFRINERQVERYYNGRIVLAGDAAHIHSPAGGQGMNTGMQDAANLAWKLALILQGAADEALLLDSYDIERRDVGERTLKVAGRMTTLGILKHPLAQAMRNRLFMLLMSLRPIQRFFARQLAGFRVRYRDTPLNGENAIGLPFGLGSRPGVGTRFPVTDRAPSAVHRPLFQLAGHLSDAAMALLSARYPALLDPQLRVMPSPIAQGGLWLLRPDGYVAVSAVAGDIAAIEAYLKKIAARPGGSAVTAISSGRLDVAAPHFT